VLTDSRCRCGAQFCYVCGARWKTCGCAHVDEARLYEQAARVVVRNGPINVVPASES